MPLKGVLFQQLLYADPAERLMSDVDVLVPEGSFESALCALREASFKPQKIGRSLIEVALRSPKGMALDLHKRLFSRARYRLSTESVFRRASRDDSLLGVPLYIAHPLDTAAHLIGKFVSDHVVGASLSRLQELLLWVRRWKIDPVCLSAHLQANGLGRAGRYTFGCGAELLGDPFFYEALGALPLDPVGWACARVARAVIPRWPRTPLAVSGAHLLNSSLPRAAASVVCAGVNRLRHSRRALVV